MYTDLNTRADPGEGGLGGLPNFIKRGKNLVREHVNALRVST